MTNITIIIVSMYVAVYDNNINVVYIYIQAEKALYDAATRGDISTVRLLIRTNVNINCTPYQVQFVTHNTMIILATIS